MDRETAKKIAAAAREGLNNLTPEQRDQLVHPVAELIKQGADVKDAIEVATKGRRNWALTQGWAREDANALAWVTLLACTAKWAAEIVATRTR